MMPRLQAEDSLRRAEATALGSGALEASAARRLASELQRQARGEEGLGAGRLNRADPAALAAIGIGVTVVEPRATGD